MERAALTKILMIVPYPIVPPDEGGRVRAYNLLKRLAVSHEIVLLSPVLPAGARNDLPVTLYETSRRGRRHQILSPGFLIRAVRIMLREHPDVIVSEYPWPGIHAWLLSVAFHKPLVLDAPNIEASRFRSVGAWYWRLVAAYEGLIRRLARRVFVVSEQDRATLLRAGVAPAKIEIVPNGVDPDVMHPDAVAGGRVRRELGVDDNTRLYLFFGQLDYAPNREALALLRDDIMPRLDRGRRDYTVIVVGKGDMARLRQTFEHERVRFVGRVDAMAAYINAADAVVAPILSGGGTRLKILESIACGVPVVSTSIGAEGIDRAVCGELLTIADDWDTFAERLLDVERGRSAGEPPRGFLNTYAWANIVQRIRW